MPTAEQKRIASIAERIEHYLADHPKAADSVEGIACWWLAESNCEGARDDVALALDQLVRRGIVARIESPDGQILYARQDRRSMPGRGAPGRAGGA